MADVSVAGKLEITDEEVQKAITALPETPEGILARHVISTLVKIIQPLPLRINELEKENAALQKRITELESSEENHVKRMDGQYEKLIQMETELWRLDQYGRRNNLEVDGIPENVKQEDLEDTAIKIFAEIGVQIKKRDIEACHRLSKRPGRKGPRKTILRFVNRKKISNIYQQKKGLQELDSKKLGLGNSRIYVNSNLNRHFCRLFWNARKLLKDGKVNSVWYATECIKIRVAEDSDPLVVTHQSGLDRLFPDFNFNAI